MPKEDQKKLLSKRGLRKKEQEEQLIKQNKEEEKIRLEDARARKIIQDAEQKKHEESQKVKQLQQNERQLTKMYNKLLVKCSKTAEELEKVKMSEVKLSAKIDALSERVINQMALQNDDKKGEILYWFTIIFNFKGHF